MKDDEDEDDADDEDDAVCPSTHHHVLCGLRKENRSNGDISLNSTLILRWLSDECLDQGRGMGMK